MVRTSNTDIQGRLKLCLENTNRAAVGLSVTRHSVATTRYE